MFRYFMYSLKRLLHVVIPEVEQGDTHPIFPNEIISLIMKSCDARTVCALTQVSKQFYSIAQDDVSKLVKSFEFVLRMHLFAQCKQDIWRILYCRALLTEWRHRVDGRNVVGREWKSKYIYAHKYLQTKSKQEKKIREATLARYRLVSPHNTFSAPSHQICRLVLGGWTWWISPHGISTPHFY